MGYKFRSYDIEDKIKYAKPNSFFETIRQKFQKTGKNYRNLEESDITLKDFDLQKKVVHEAWGDRLGFMKKVFSKINTAEKTEKRKAELITESYSKNVFTEKAQKDLIYFRTLFENAFDGQPEEFQKLKNEVINLFESVLKDVIELYQETNTKPRFINPALNKTYMTEDEIIKIYNRHFKQFLQENYLKPLIKQELQEAEEIKKFTRFLAENNVNVNMEDVITYLPFEKTIKEFLEHVLIPETSMKKIEIFMESQAPEYFEIFDKNAKVLLESIEDKIMRIASVLAPFLFEKTVDADMSVNPTQFAGLSIVCKKVNDGPMICEIKKEETPDVNDEIEDIPEDDEDVEDIEDIEVDDDVDPEEIVQDELEAEMIDNVVKDEDKEEYKEDKEEDKEDEDTKKEKDNEKKEIKESTEINESESKKIDEPGNSKVQEYNTEKELEKVYNTEEIIKDEADNVKDLKDAAKEEK
jgi:hypothetical protein